MISAVEQETEADQYDNGTKAAFQGFRGDIGYEPGSNPSSDDGGGTKIGGNAPVDIALLMVFEGSY